MRYLRDTVIIAADVTTSPVGTLIDANQLFSISAQAIATGSPVGTVKLQASNDFLAGNAILAGEAPINWTDIPSATASISAAGSVLIPKTDLCYRWVRVVYTATSGTGTVTVNITALSV